MLGRFERGWKCLRARELCLGAKSEKRERIEGLNSWGVYRVCVATRLDAASILPGEEERSAGVKLESSSFDVKRAYSAYGYEDSKGIMMNYKGLGIRFILTMDLMVSSISVSAPQ
jgi:hypothetical protein